MEYAIFLRSSVVGRLNQHPSGKQRRNYIRMNTIDVRLYLATDPHLLGTRDLLETVEAAIEGGVTIVQLRDKAATGRELYETARRLLQVTRRRNVPLIINDRLDVMLAAEADGVHIGPHDLPADRVRVLAGRKIVGLSVNSAVDLETAHAASVDYIGIGPVFPTATKTDLRPVLGIDGLHALAMRSQVPCVAIGGISVTNCHLAIAAGATGVCTISGILGGTDVRECAQAFRHHIDAEHGA